MSKKSFKLSEISDFLGGQLVGDGSKTVTEIKTLSEAVKGSISFIYSKKFRKDLEVTSASAVLISKEYTENCHVDYILVKNPHESYAKLTQLFSGNLRSKILNKNYADSYSKKDIEVKVEENALSVKSIREDADGKQEVIHQGISKRYFERHFTIADDVEVLGAELKDGLLTISLERIIPEHKKAKTIEIK